ncbi:hypothetical protein TIFTF001_025252 [Ficus carica]|uniref:Uncharacterized protein n=1 Tax=Ficus carica TaxID=3494 RepID=A0AA88AQY8_FICCA|nr:hypothetical protein TIFTF001_025252 [Ficus carica]
MEDPRQSKNGFGNNEIVQETLAFKEKAILSPTNSESLVAKEMKNAGKVRGNTEEAPTRELHMFRASFIGEKESSANGGGVGGEQNIFSSGFNLKDHLKMQLPEGFEERKSGKGKIVEWTPQTQVLAGPSFCGCNSIYDIKRKPTHVFGRLSWSPSTCISARRAAIFFEEEISWRRRGLQFGDGEGVEGRRTGF